jgi:FlaG/FlaF family flagellin (archaellin)
LICSIFLMSDDDFGVSPVIGVVLLVALVVILAGVVGIVFFDIGSQERNPGLQSGLVTDIEETPDGVEVSTLESGSGGQILVDGEPVRNISENDTGETFILDNVSEGSTVAVKPNESEDITQTEKVSKNYSGGSGGADGSGLLSIDTESEWVDSENTSASSGFDIKSDIDDGYIEAVNGQGVYYGKNVSLSEETVVEEVEFKYDASGASNKRVAVSAFVNGPDINRKLLYKGDSSPPVYTSGSGNESFITNISKPVTSISPFIITWGNQSNGTAAEIFSVNYKGNSDITKIVKTKNMVLRTDQQWSQGNFDVSGQPPTELGSLTIPKTLTGPRSSFSCCYEKSSFLSYSNVTSDEIFVNSYRNSVYLHDDKIEWTPEYPVSYYDVESDIIYMANGITEYSANGRVFAYDSDGNKLFDYNAPDLSGGEIRDVESDGDGVYYIVNGYDRPSSYLVKLDNDGNVLWNKSVSGGNNVLLNSDIGVVIGSEGEVLDTSTGSRIQDFGESVEGVYNNSVYTSDYNEPLKRWVWNGSGYTREWSKEFSSRYPDGVYQYGSIVYVEDGTDLYKLDLSNGNTLWNITNSTLSEFSVSIQDDGYFYYLYNEDTGTDVYRLEKSNGEIEKFNSYPDVTLEDAAGSSPESVFARAYTSGSNEVPGVNFFDLTDSKEWLNNEDGTPYYYSRNFGFNESVSIKNASLRINNIDNASYASITILISDSKLPEYDSLSLNSIKGGGVWVHPDNSTSGKEYYNVGKSTLNSHPYISLTSGTDFRIQVGITPKSPVVSPPSVEFINITGEQVTYE